jgi:hypothetical protein
VGKIELKIDAGPGKTRKGLKKLEKGTDQRRKKEVITIWLKP